MTSYNIKCKGCGSYLNDDPTQPGYIAKYIEGKTLYCKRCFRLINYGEIDNTNVSSHLIDDVLDNLNLKRAHIFHVVDVLDLENTILPRLNDLTFVTIIVNKTDCLPKHNEVITRQKIVDTLESKGFFKRRIIYTSDHHKKNLEIIFQIAKDAQLNHRKAYFVGCSNVGKSSLINGIAKIKKVTPELTVSPFINTTLQLKKTKIERIEFIDTPGVLYPDNILNYVDPKIVKNIISSKKIKTKGYQLNAQQSLMIEGLALINYHLGTRTTFTFYGSNDLNVLRMKLENAPRNWDNRANLAKFQFNDVIENVTIIQEEKKQKVKTKPIDNTSSIINNDINIVKFVENFNEDKLSQIKVFKNETGARMNLIVSGLGLIVINAGAREVSVITHRDVRVLKSKYAII